MNVFRFCLGLALLLSASAAVGAEPACSPTIEKAWVRAAPPGARTLAGYLVLRNACTTAVEVVAVESRDFGKVDYHLLPEDKGNYQKADAAGSGI